MKTIIWREFYNEAAVAALTKMGTLPSNVFELEENPHTEDMDGEDIAQAIAAEANEQDSSSFREGGEIVIVEPEEFAGTYNIVTEYRPSFYASKED